MQLSPSELVLPDDVEALKALVVQQHQQIAELKHNVEVFRRMAFGTSSEKRRGDESPNRHAGQGHLFCAELLAEAERVARQKDVEGSVEISQPSKPKKPGKRRTTFPDHLPRVTTLYALPEQQRRCKCGGELHEIGRENTRELERLETTIVHQIDRAKYACRSCEEGVVTAPGPDRVIDKGLLGPGFLAHVIADRFGNHMPYYRLEKKFASEGLDLSRSVLERSMARCAELLEPIYTEIKSQVKGSGVIFTDDTPVTVARPSSAPGSKLGRVWCYVDGEDQVAYDFTESRKRDGPLSFLVGFTGFAHADAYAGYDALFLPDDVSEVGCWAHARRYFVNAETTDPVLAREAIDRIRLLYRVEREGKDLEPDARRALREQESVPLLESLRGWLAGVEAKVLPKSPMARAVGYVQAQWDALTRYVTDGRLEIDNNRAERALRPFAVGRKNWLFFQTAGGGRTGVVLMSLLMSAKAAGLDPRVYFRDVLLRIAHETDVSKLTPKGWREHYAATVTAERDAAVAKILGR